MSSSMWRALLVSSLFTLGLLTPGCQIIIGIEDLRQGPDGGGSDHDATHAPDAATAPGFDLEVRTIDATIPLDGKNVIDVEIRRYGGFTGAVTVTAPEPPVGIVVTELVVAGGVSSAQIEVGAIGPLQIGDAVSFDLVASAAQGLEASAAVNDATITDKPGTFDVTFGAQQTGYATVSLGSDDDGSFYDVEVLPNGDVLALGSSTGGLGAGFMILARFTAGGLLDPVFNGGALVRTNFETGSSGEACAGYAVGRQVDGSILGIGWSAAGAEYPPDIALIQRTAGGGEGSPSYGSHGGKSRVDLGGNEEVWDGLVLPDSKVLAVGRTNDRLFLARIGTQGSLDTSFASGGFHVLDRFLRSGGEAVITDASGRILVAGYVEDGLKDMVVLRYTKNGELDTTFGQGGVVVAGNPDGHDRAVAIAVRPDGRIVVAGEALGEGGTLDIQIRQFQENGAPDPSFGVEGVSTVASPGNDEPEDIALLPDGRILVAGNTPGNGPFLARLMRGGALDPYFGHEGLFPLYLGDSGVVRGLEVFSNAKVLISGGNHGGTPGPGTFGVVVRMWM